MSTKQKYIINDNYQSINLSGGFLIVQGVHTFTLCKFHIPCIATTSSNNTLLQVHTNTTCSFQRECIFWWMRPVGDY